MKGKRLILILLILMMLSITAGAGYYYFFYRPKEPVQSMPVLEERTVEYTYLRIFYPIAGRMEIFDKRIPGLYSTLKLAEIIVQEYLNLSSGFDAGVVPKGSKLKGLFLSSDGILYLNFNNTLKKGFRADILDEYLFLKSLYDTLVSNLDIADIVILVNDREVETLGGHFIIDRPLKSLFSKEVFLEEGIE